MPALGKVYKNRGNRWKIRLSGGIEIWADKQHRSFHSREHAEYTLAQITGEIQSGTFDPDFYSKTKKSLHSFSVYAEEWLSNCQRRKDRNELSITYLGSLRNYVRNIFLPYFKEKPITEIRGRDLKQFYLSLDYSPKSLWNIMSALHKIFKDAYEEEVIQAIPKFPMEFRASTLPDPEWKWADVETQDLIFANLTADAHLMILFSATHGTRPGETRALQHHDIDLKNDLVTIQRAFADNDLRPFTKSKRIRIVPLDPNWKELYLTRPRHVDAEGFVFCDSTGKPHGRNWCRNQWNAAREKAGVAHITLYQGTRHSIASQAVNDGQSLYKVSKFLGHSNLEQTKRYSHLEVNALRSIQRKATVTPLKKSNQ